MSDPQNTSLHDADSLERRIVLATQAGLPLTARPYAAVADAVGASETDVRGCLDALLARGVIRRIGAVPNHYALGYTANGMSVWDIDDKMVDAVGELVGAIPFVTHCYRRPRRLPDWPYNMFAMIHGTSRDEVLTRVADTVAQIERQFRGACRRRDILFSTAILKKTGLRIGS